MKKVLAMILTLCMLFALTSAVGYADDAKVECDDVTLTFC